MSPAEAPVLPELPAPRSSLWLRAFWCIVFLGLVGWQAWMTLTLFGADASLQNLMNEEPVISGRHPLHFYHGYLGARSQRERGTSCCYDPANLAGYPKTPVFDDGSRLAELCLLLARGTQSPAAYKVGLAVCCLLVPWLLLLAAWGVGLGPGPTCLTVLLGEALWWGLPCQAGFEAGDVDLLLAALAALVFVTLLIRFHNAPGFLAWLGLAIVGCLGWFAHPLLFGLIVLPAMLVWYLRYGPRHGLFWHVFLTGSVLTGLAPNAVWLIDWGRHWWLRADLPAIARALPHRTFQSFWDSDLWGEPFDRGLAVALIGSALGGLIVLHRSSNRAASRLLTLPAATMLVLALLGIGWQETARLGAFRLLVPAAWFALLPAVFCWLEAFRILTRWTGGPIRAGLLTGAGLTAGLVLLAPSWEPLNDHLTQAKHLQIGLADDQKAIVEALKTETDASARILWEDCADDADAAQWTALLPFWTDRAYFGGLDPAAVLEHSHVSFTNGKLIGQPLCEWTDANLEGFCRRYNIGWVMCTSAESIARFQAWTEGGESRAKLTAQLAENGKPRCLFTLTRPRSYILKGQARWLAADCRRIELADLVPDNGTVVLSLHYQPGMRISPNRVQLERDPDSRDPISFVRLKVPGFVARATLTWEKP